MAPPLTKLQRAQIIALHNTGSRVIEIERLTGIARKTIYFWIKRYELGGTLDRSPRAQYPRATTAEEDQGILDAHAQDPSLPYREIAQRFNICRKTVKRRLQEAGLKPCRPKKSREQEDEELDSPSDTLRELLGTPAKLSPSAISENLQKLKEKTIPKLETIVTPGLRCSSCSKKIREKRFQCLQCADVLVCAACERKKMHDQHAMMLLPTFDVYNKLRVMFESLRREIGVKLSVEEDEDSWSAIPGLGDQGAGTVKNETSAEDHVKENFAVRVSNTSTTESSQLEELEPIPTQDTSEDEGPKSRQRHRRAKRNRTNKNSVANSNRENACDDDHPLNDEELLRPVDLLIVKQEPDPLLDESLAPIFKRSANVDTSRVQQRIAQHSTVTGAGDSDNRMFIEQIQIKIEPTELILDDDITDTHMQTSSVDNSDDAAEATGLLR